ncbi:ectonucleotide pyrophosphatase/phosphodiesterase [Ectobacillus panaciterrae]|uniref:alkaline phosphatase family protein n=1 Tax=Ectobacillus panaciterrae TaxID=363872 RepID=UPI000427D426|nr:ectonucleotide pyrophosphatase/phosphodiesterase [Ectobacillus panaciterrae]
MGEALTKYVIIISFDCLSSLDFPLLQALPNFRSLLKNGAYAKHVESIYPSVTYPCHATIVTGNYPSRHGVVSNTLLQPGRHSPDWHWYRRSVQGTTLYDEAKKANLITAALLWPVTAKAKIDYNMPEIFPNRPWQNQILTSLLSGSPLYQWEMNRRFGHIRNGLNQPELDDFVLASAVHTIETKLPNVLLIHFTDLDTQRHLHGFSSKQAMDAIRRHDERLGQIINTLKKGGIYENATIIALGDHSALNEAKALHVNVLLRQNELLKVNKHGKVKSWKAYCKSCDGSAYIYLKNSNDTDTKQTVSQLLTSLLNDSYSGVEFVLNGEDAKKHGADGNCLFMLEAEKGYYFLEDWTGPYMKTIMPADVTANKKYTLATHGYSPTKEHYTTIFMAAGKGIRQNIVIPFMRLIDEGPTIARLLGLSLGDTDGKIIEELLTND